MRACFALPIFFAFLIASCSSTGVDLPIVTRENPFPPVEGLETTNLAGRAHGVILCGSGERPIEITHLPSRKRRDHAIRGSVVALAGPTPAGRFVYAVRDERDALSIRRADLDGGDRPALRFPRAISALAIAPDAQHAAVLSPFDDEDARSRGGILRELVIVDLERGEYAATGLALRNATPAWVDSDSIACVAADADGAWFIQMVDRRAPNTPRELAVGEGVLADPAHAAVLIVRRDEKGMHAVRAPLAGGAETELVLRGALQPLALVGDGLIVSFSSPTLGAEPQWEFDLFGPQIALATIKLHELAEGGFQTIEPRASPRRLWSAGALADPTSSSR